MLIPLAGNARPRAFLQNLVDKRWGLMGSGCVKTEPATGHIVMRRILRKLLRFVVALCVFVACVPIFAGVYQLGNEWSGTFAWFREDGFGDLQFLPAAEDLSVCNVCVWNEEGPHCGSD